MTRTALQKAFDFEAGAKRDDALRQALKPYRLPHWPVELIVMMARDGRPREIGGHRCFELTISKRQASKKLGCSPNTFLNAAAELSGLRVLEIVKFGQQFTYVLSRDQIDQMAPPGDDPLDELPLFTQPPPSRSPLVNGGQRVVSPPRAVERERNISRGTCHRVTVENVPRGAGVDQPLTRSPAAAGGVTLRSLTDEDFRPLDGLRLQAGLDDCIAQRWLEDEPEDHRKYWALCHHASVSEGIRTPARFVYSRIKQYDFNTINQVSWDWSGRFVRREELQENHADR